MQSPSPTTAPVYNDIQGLEQLRSAAAKDPQGALRKVAQQFEGLFIQMMLKSMRAAVPSDDLFGSDTMKTYQEMYDNQLALSMARVQHMGISDMLVKQLGGIVAREQDTATGTGAAAAGAAPTASRRALEAYGGVAPADTVASSRGPG